MKKIMAAILLCAMLGIMLVSCAPKIIYVDKEPQGGGVGLVVDPNANNEALQTDPVEVPGIAIPGWGTLKIPAGQKDNSIANFNNPAEHAGKYFLKFELSLTKADGTKEVLYTSGLVEPGKYIQTISLSRALEAGEYEANMFVQPYKISDQSPTNNLNSKMKLIVVNAGTSGN